YDKFVLGDSSRAFYVGKGAKDFAGIADFTVGKDKLVLFGSADQYRVNEADGSSEVLFNGDRIAILQNTGHINLKHSAHFV
ncbi:MAG: hypothetical protein AAGJ80_07935, partial [Cyanobacteria bacterium J06553_1]